MKKFISYKKSLEILEQINISTLSKEKLYLMETLNRVLSSDIIANENSPAFKTSAMDGYAVKFEDLQLGKLQIIDTNPAGSIVESKVQTATTIKTFTGSLMPEGSDTLIPIENVTVEGEFIIINEKVPKGFAVRKVGENFKDGETLIKKHTLVDFAQIGVMASLNKVQVEVYSKPTVAIASTGSEILDLGEVQTNNSQIRSSNHLTLEAIARNYGANVHQLGVVKDDKKSITKMIENALLKSDIVVTTGGVSVGDYDFVKDVIKDELNCEVLFQGVNIKPGQHILFAKKGNKFIIGLPGFAYSSTITFLLYVVPMILKLRGDKSEPFKIVEAILDEPYPKKGNKTSFNTCNLEFKDDGKYHIDFQGKKGASSAVLTNMLNSPALLIQDENDEDLKIGDKAKVMII